VNDRESENRPRDRFMECYVLVEGDERIKGCPSNDGDEVSANWKNNEGGIQMQYEGSGPSDSCYFLEIRSS
jgi:hypothetical protein